jgi:xeroderma pigmentosum group C-complementing protein
MGAQLYCAFLRSTGLDVRLVCSLQPLPLQASTKGIPVPRGGISSSVPETPTRDSSEDVEAIDIYGQNSPFSAGGSSTNTPRVPFSSRQRLGHPNAADYRMPSMHTPTPKQSPKPKKKRIIESPYPIFWLEVLDEAHQKWLPVDPLVTHTIAKPHFLEPPANDAENALTYVFAFESDGVVRDVTRRYTKHWAAKILKSRVESTPGGELWLRKALRPYSRGFKSDLDQIEDVELANLEAKEGMPTSIADFKKHPRFVLERDLKRNEVLVRRQEAGKVRAGKKLESVFRRMDVKNVKSAEGWYRLGREVKEGEVPAKIRPRMRRARAESVEGDDGEDGDEPGTPMYTEAQTELYVPPPVVNGRVPRNVYGNLDVYVPSMVPEGGVHVQRMSYPFLQCI